MQFMSMEITEFKLGSDAEALGDRQSALDNRQALEIRLDTKSYWQQ